MKQFALLAAIAALVIAGCGPKEEAGTDAPATTSGGTAGKEGGTGGSPVLAVGYDVGSKKVGDMGSCAVCTVKEGKVPADEEAKAVVDYNGKTYLFCDEAEKADFISDPKKYVGS